MNRVTTSPLLVNDISITIQFHFIETAANELCNLQTEPNHSNRYSTYKNQIKYKLQICSR